MANGADKDYAIVIGIDAYTGLRTLRSAVNDANEFMKWLREEEGLDDPGQIIPILGDTPYAKWTEAKPNGGSVDEALIELGLLKGKKIGRRLYFYFSGHGFTTVDSDVGMALANAALGFLKNSISMRGCHSIFQELRYFDEVIFILDCCREKTEYPELPSTPASSIDFLKSKFPNGAVAAPDPFKDLLVLATSYGDKSLAPVVKEIGERRGLLTIAVLEGLRGKAALENGDITAASLRAYTEARVKELAGEHKVPQEAQINDSNSRGMVIRNIPTPTVQVKINVSAAIRGELILHDKGIRVMAGDLHQNASVWEVSLPKRLAPYFIESTDPVSLRKLDLSQVDESVPYEFAFPGA